MVMNLRTDDEPPAEKLRRLKLYHIFIELISRIIPGLALIGACFFWDDGDFTDISPTMSLFIIIMAWICGVVLDSGEVSSYYGLLPYVPIAQNGS